MKNYDGAVAILNMLDQNNVPFSEKEIAQLENMAIRMIKPPKQRFTLKRWADEQLDRLNSERPDYSQFIPMIREVRNKTGWLLTDAKKWVEKNFSDSELNRKVLDF